MSLAKKDPAALSGYDQVDETTVTDKVLADLMSVVSTSELGVVESKRSSDGHMKWRVDGECHHDQPMATCTLYHKTTSQLTMTDKSNKRELEEDDEQDDVQVDEQVEQQESGPVNMDTYVTQDQQPVNDNTAVVHEAGVDLEVFELTDNM